MIIYDGGFFAELYQERIACVTGSLGTGKTLITHAIAQPFLRDGYKFFGNISSAWLDDIEKVKLTKKGEQVHAVVVCDEGGLYVRRFEDVKRLSSYARKLDIYIIFAGKKLPHEDLQALRLYVWFDFYKNFLIPLRVWRYDVQVDITKNYHGYLFETGWWAYYGLYSTLDPGGDVEDILKSIDMWIKDFGGFYGRKQFGGGKDADKIPSVDKGSTLGADVVELGEIRDAISKKVTQASYAISQYQRKTKR